MTGYLLNERFGKVQFWLLFIGTQLFTLPQYLVGLLGMPRRMMIYPNDPEWKNLNMWSTAGALMIGLSTVVFVVNIVVSWKKTPAGDNPWDGHTLEWFHHLTAAAPQLLPSSEDPLRASDVGTTTTPKRQPWLTAPTRRSTDEARISHPAAPRPVLRHHVCRLLALESGERWRRDDVRRDAAGLPARFLLWWWSRRIGTRPEDDDNATQADGAGIIDAFPATSIFPFTLGMGAFMTVLALVFGIWLLLPGLGLVTWALIGGTAESRRGGEI
jgi:hypothetical protein